MSVPSATWTVQGIPARYAARTRLVSACGQLSWSRYRPSAVAKAGFVLAGGAGRDGERIGGLASHAEQACGKLGGDVLAGLAGNRQLDVVNGRGAVEGDRRQNATVDPVDEVRCAAGFDDVAAEGRGDRATLALGSAQMFAYPAQSVARQLSWQRLQPGIDGGPGFHGPAELVVKDLGRPGAEVIGLQTVQIERRHRRPIAHAGLVPSIHPSASFSLWSSAS